MRRMARSTRATAVIVAAVLIGAILLFSGACHAAQNAALRPVAERLGTRPTYWEVVNKMTFLLNGRKGQSQAEVHAFLSSLGRVSYLGPFKSGEGTSENATWVPVDTPALSLGTATVWDLTYDANGRLIKVELVDAP
jgi:hypothetical protein